MADTYANWAQLAAANSEGIDYRLPIRKNNSVFAHIAIHGGAIEPGSSEMASEVAAQTYQSYYSLEGIKPANNSTLHIVSTNYDEPVGLNLVKKANYCVSYHQYPGTGGVADCRVNGNDFTLRSTIIAYLRNAGFTVGAGDSEGDESNIANIALKTTRGMGINIEMSAQQCANFFPGGNTSQANRETGIRTDAFYAFAHAIAMACNQVETRSQQTPNYDLNKPMPTDQMNDFETWLNSNWTKLGSVNKFATVPELPTTGNFQPGDRVIRQVDNSPYICICNDPNWGIFWRPVIAAMSPWRTIPDTALADTLNWTLQTAGRPFQYAIDNHGMIHWRGLIKWTGAGGISKNISVRPFKNLPDGIQPRTNVSQLIGHGPLTITGGGTPATEWEGVYLNIPHDPINGTLQTIEILAVAGNGAGSINTFYINGQLNWSIGNTVFSDAFG